MVAPLLNPWFKCWIKWYFSLLFCIFGSGLTMSYNCENIYTCMKKKYVFILKKVLIPFLNLFIWYYIYYLVILCWYWWLILVYVTIHYQVKYSIKCIQTEFCLSLPLLRGSLRRQLCGRYRRNFSLKNYYSCIGLKLCDGTTLLNWWYVFLSGYSFS